MIKPDYKGGSIVNLMSSISKVYNVDNQYVPLKGLDVKELSKSKNIIVLIIDGLGYEYLITKGKNSFLYKHIHTSMTSIFPSTTASAITTFDTGVAPMQHGIVGWFTYLKELGVVSTPLRFTPRYGGPTFESIGLKRNEIFTFPKFYDRIKESSFQIMPKKVISSSFKKGRQTTYSYGTLNSFFSHIKKAVKSHNKKKYIYAYWPGFDGTSHVFGSESKEAFYHFKELDNGIKQLVEKLKGTNTTLLVTADHGFIDTKPSQIIDLRNHPDFLDTLSMPLSGDARVKYCYVRLAKEKQFKNYINKHFKKYCDVFKSEDLIKKNFFGLFKPHKRLSERIGDYVLIMKENYKMNDPVLGTKSKGFIGHHSGVSKKEMFVPLIKFNL